MSIKIQNRIVYYGLACLLIAVSIYARQERSQETIARVFSQDKQVNTLPLKNESRLNSSTEKFLHEYNKSLTVAQSSEAGKNAQISTPTPSLEKSAAPPPAKIHLPKHGHPAFDQPMFQLPLELREKDQHALEKEAHKALKELSPEEEEEKIEFQFENADLISLVQQIEKIFDYTFILNEDIQPAKPGSKQIKGNKITFKTNKPLNKKEAWNLFITFLDLAGFTIVPYTQPKVYEIQTVETAVKSPVPTFIGVAPETLPDNDEIIRYVYFIENSTVAAIGNVVDALRSSGSLAIKLEESKGIIFVDKAYNIKSLMKIVKELDKVTMPQALSVLKLRRVDADQVKKLYDSLTQSDEKTQPRFATARRQPTSLYFPENIRIISEPRTNALILLGPKDAIKKIEDFIVKYIDVELDQTPSPLQVMQLHFADAETIATIMNQVTAYSQNTPAGAYGGLRGGDKFLRPMAFIPEKETNRIIIKGYYDDFLMAKKIIEELDEAQPQVAIDVLVLSLTIDDNKEFGTQIRSKDPGISGLVGKNVKFQTSGIRLGGAPQGIVENPTGFGVDRLLGNILKLVTSATPGNTIISLGQDIFGVWGILAVLRTIANLEVISNPFIIATNKADAVVSIGETRRVVTGTIIPSSGPTDNTFGSDQAALTVSIKPQINSDGFIILDLTVDNVEFTSTDPTSATKQNKTIKTQTIVANKEILALGGLIRNRIANGLSKVPVLGDIPIFGWLFKNKNKEEQKENLLILISTQIIDPRETQIIGQFTKHRVGLYQDYVTEMKEIESRRDPVQRLFFSEKKGSTEALAETFIFDRGHPQERAERLERELGIQESKRPGPVVVEKPSPTTGKKTERRRRKKKNIEKKSDSPVAVPTQTIPESAPLKQKDMDSDKGSDVIALPMHLRDKIHEKKRKNLSVTHVLSAAHKEQG